MRPAALHRSGAQSHGLQISDGDTNYFVILFDPATDGFDHISVIEIFRVGGRTPPNSHRSAHEFFYVLQGQGRAFCQGASIDLVRGDSLLLRPGCEHVVENTGVTKLYTLTVMFPDEAFAGLIRSGRPVPLDAEDLEVLAAQRSA
jgi:mannose-6-phosphate isomerase-like protein (cupin superfamily)